MSSSAAIISELAAALRSGKYKSVAILTGAGVSVNSGIPDFRSPGGLYDTLRPALLTATPSQRRAMKYDPTTVISWELFRVNPLPYMEVRRPFILGTAESRWKLTVAHLFPRLLADKGLLHHVFTQNIDGLDYQSGVGCRTSKWWQYMEASVKSLVNIAAHLRICQHSALQ